MCFLTFTHINTWDTWWTHGAASLCPDKTVFPSLLCAFSCSFSQKHSYSCELLLKINKSKSTNFSYVDELQITLRNCELLQRHLPQWKCLRRCKRKQKRGKCGGIQSRLAANPHKPAIPTNLLSNMRSLDNNLDHVWLLWSTLKSAREYCVFVFVETWLNNSIPDSVIRADRALTEGCRTCRCLVS